jgi:hypothetical protein
MVGAEDGCRDIATALIERTREAEVIAGRCECFLQVVDFAG